MGRIGSRTKQPKTNSRARRAVACDKNTPNRLQCSRLVLLWYGDAVMTDHAVLGTILPGLLYLLLHPSDRDFMSVDSLMIFLEFEILFT